MTDFSKTLVRCSKLSVILTNIDSATLTKGHLTFCKQLYRELKWKRKAQIKSKYLEKGILQEEDAITLLSRYKGILLKKNEERISNEYITGEPDLYLGPSIRKAEEGYDTKCSWSVDTFPYPEDKLDDSYLFQDHGYMALTGASKWTTAFCLVNAPGHQVMSEKFSLMRRFNYSELDKAYIKGCKDIERNMIFDLDQFMKDNPHFDIHNEIWDYDIPLKERVMEYPVMRDENVIDKIYERVKLVRKELERLAGRTISKNDFALDLSN
jgi:hypothetical protein